MGSIDHQLFPFAASGRVFGQDSTEDTEPTPADEVIVNRLVRTVFLWRVAPAQSVANDEDHATYDLTVIYSRKTAG
ncbi:hypothetical protein BLM14_18245 [Phyllobacterium zundukense]|nr:hypothetical protein BLM14_18245 [Phyllobacterium zundukense]